MRLDLERVIAEALAREFTEPVTVNPAHDRSEERRVEAAGGVYDVPYCVPHAMADRVQRRPWVTEIDQDGCQALSVPSIARIARIAARGVLDADPEVV